MLFLVLVCASSPYHNCLTGVGSCPVLAEGLLSGIRVHLSVTAALAGLCDSACWAGLPEPHTGLQYFIGSELLCVSLVGCFLPQQL